MHIKKLQGEQYSNIVNAEMRTKHSLDKWIMEEL